MDTRPPTSIVSPPLTCLLIGLSLWSSQVIANDWTRVTHKQGISVFVTPVEGSDILRVKTHTVMDVSMERIQSILENVPARKNWIPYLRESRVLTRLSDTERLEYSVFSAPWPTSDRDFVYRITRLQHGNAVMIYAMKSEHSGIMTEQPGLIRAELMESVYTLNALAADKTRVELVFHADPKGWLPTWIINIIQKVLPYMILRNLRERVTATKPP